MLWSWKGTLLNQNFILFGVDFSNSIQKHFLNPLVMGGCLTESAYPCPHCLLGEKPQIPSFLHLLVPISILFLSSYFICVGCFSIISFSILKGSTRSNIYWQAEQMRDVKRHRWKITNMSLANNTIHYWLI